MHSKTERIIRVTGLALLLQAGGLLAAPDSAATADDLSSRIAQRFSRRIPSTHLMRLPMGDVVSGRAWTNFFTSLDFDHMYFLQADIDRFADRRTALDDHISAGDLSFAKEAFDLFKQRVGERCTYVDGLLTNGFDLAIEEDYRWNRRKADWPATLEACNDLWRRKIKNEYLRQIVVRRLAEENKDEPEAPREVEPDAPAPSNGVDNAAAVIDDDAVPAPPPELTPEEFIRKRYKQMLTMLQDSDGEWLTQKYLSAFAHAYDPHSDYMSASGVEDFDIEMKLSLIGIGALLRAEDGAARIVRLIPGGPADMDTRDVRLRAGDKIIAVGQDSEPIVDVLHWPLNRIVALIRGKKGSRVVMTVIPASDPSGSSTKQVDLVRGEVKLEEQAADSTIHKIMDANGDTHKLGVIALPAFYASMAIRDVNHPEYRSASHDVHTILQAMQTAEVEGVILDLRNNGGGSLMEAIQMTGLFIRTGPTVQVRERHSVRVLPDRDPAIAYAGPLVVLVNRLSASASEIVAAALQDYGRALIVGGQKTHGKGTVQTIVGLSRDRSLGSLRVTTASYYRISGGSTQLRGVTPDIIIPSPYDYMKLGEDALPNPMPWSAVMPARFVPVADLDGVKPQLRETSEARRAASPRFAAYQKLLDRVKAINEAEVLPLDLERRMAFARAEKALAELQESLMPERSGEEDDDTADVADLVLEETLQILSEFAATKHATAALHNETLSQERTPLMHMLDQLLQTPQ